MEERRLTHMEGLYASAAIALLTGCSDSSTDRLPPAAQPGVGEGARNEIILQPGSTSADAASTGEVGDGGRGTSDEDAGTARFDAGEENGNTGAVDASVPAIDPVGCTADQAFALVLEEVLEPADPELIATLEGASVGVYPLTMVIRSSMRGELVGGLSYTVQSEQTHAFPRSLIPTFVPLQGQGDELTFNGVQSEGWMYLESEQQPVEVPLVQLQISLFRPPNCDEEVTLELDATVPGEDADILLELGDSEGETDVDEAVDAGTVDAGSIDGSVDDPPPDGVALRLRFSGSRVDFDFEELP